MPHFSFITPSALALLILVPFVWAFTLLSPRRIARWRFWLSLLIRTASLFALIFALSGMQLIRPIHSLTTVFLIDASDSVAPTQRERAVSYVEEALHTMSTTDQAAIVVFGDNALVERAPAHLLSLGHLSSVPISTRTNIQDAIQLGLALLPADTQKRLVLLSDGGENSGHAADAARLAAIRGVPIDIVSLPSEHGPDVLVRTLDVPGTAREGQEIAASVAINSAIDTHGRLQIFVDGQLVGTQDVTLKSGLNNIPLRLPAGKAGFRRLEVRVDAQGDTEPENNRAMAFTEVQGPPRLLIIASDASRAENLQLALVAAGVQVDLRGPNQVPVDLPQLSDYAAIIIVDTPARDMPRPLLETLPVYVRELGRGLAMIGGQDSFGAGGYRRTPLVDALPVNLDPHSSTQQSDVALAMVIDHSGSMADSGSTGGRSKLELAKEAVYQASLGLSPQDQIGLFVFDTTAQTILPIQKLPSAVDIEQALGRFSADGGTDIRPGLELAAQALPQANARIKHVILLTDGIADSNYGDLVDQMRKQGITISTVAIGDDANPNLEQIAIRGGGRFYRVERVEDIPRIFLHETVVVAGRDIVEEPFTPKIALQAPIVRGLGGLPPLYGYNGTETKDTARPILVTPDDKPILAQWQYGLGRAVAWTSDLKGQWARDWIGWEQFPHFISGFVDMLLPQRVVDRLSLQTTVNGAQAAIELNAQNAQGQPLNDLKLDSRLVDPANQSTALKFVQIGPGRYRATATTSATGVYLAQVAAVDSNGQPLGTVSTGIAVSYSPEYGETRENSQLLRDLATITKGRIDPPAKTIFESPTQAVGAVQEIALPLLWLALLLWPIDIALRRLFLRFADVAPIFNVLHRRSESILSATPSGGSIARLGAAKQRARQRNQKAEGTGWRVPVTEDPSTPTVQPHPANTPRPDSATPSQEPEPKTSTSLDDQQFARLRAAKRRARDARNE